MNGHTDNNKSDDSNQSKLTIKFADNFIVDGHTEYRILVRDSKKNESWTVTSRYRDLRSIHARLRENFPNSLPNFPSKKFLGNMEPSFISQRQKALEIYFSLILQNQTWANAKPVKDLLLSKTHTKSIVSANREREETKTTKPTEPAATSNGVMKTDTNRTEKANPSHVALEKTLEQISNKFFDLQLNLNPPDDEEVKKKGMSYQKINEMGNVKTAHSYFKLPAASNKGDGSTMSAHRINELQHHLKSTLHNIKERMHSQPYLSKIEIISEFN
eukprot:CAMPEP_0176437108 /NCGR_PEP_ID=MMETSP0127-20121128/18408_1 /TAXON_ID=938130 /ORGANISM="Platyophrya macrostoma, Strain WH" /LENGTH=272 /DNA_ID=CAMNT_0017820637 /DNA_START=51 /DNA_END=869 /DNA_ORIENTATION=-